MNRPQVLCCKFEILSESPKRVFFLLNLKNYLNRSKCCVWNLKFYLDHQNVLSWKWDNLTEPPKRVVLEILPELPKSSVFEIRNHTRIAKKCNAGNWKFCLNRQKALCWKLLKLTCMAQKWFVWNLKLYLNRSSVVSQICNFTWIAQKCCVGNLKFYLNRPKVLCLKFVFRSS